MTVTVSRVQFRVLGPVEIETDHGQVVTPSRRQHRLLLAVLLLEPGRVLPAHRLVELLWDDPPEQARRALYSHVARVRAVLAKAGADAHSIALLSHGDGYLIRVQPAAVDVHRFRALVEQATKSIDLPHRDQLLRNALELWRGPALHNAATDQMRARICADLDELHLHAIEESTATGLALGRHRELIPDLARLATDYPLRSRLTRLRMLALHHTGRTTDALDVYTTARKTLAEELGLDPDPALRRLHEMILRGQPVPISDLTEPPRTPAGAATRPAQLPADIASFTGRDRHLTSLDQLLDTHHRKAPTAVVISAIAGTAGVGKTALAVHWAHQVADQFPDGQLYIDLRGFDPSGHAINPTTAVRGFLDALQVPPQRIPADLDAQVGLYRSLLVGKRMLIVLDNARDTAQVRPLLPGAPDCIVVVTSRNQLTSLIAAHGARTLTLDLLTPDEARQLLARRLGAERIAAEPDAVEEIITRCARLPLALTLVAAHAALRPNVGLPILVEDLRDTQRQWQTLSGDDPATDVRTVFSWSYQALTPHAARLFRLFGLHPGPDLTAPAAASLAAQSIEQVRPLLAELTRVNLISEHLPGRYRLHDLLHAYATHLTHTTETDGEHHSAAHRLLDYYLHTAHTTDRLLAPGRDPITPTPPQPGVITEHPTDHRQSLDWFTAEHAVLLRMVNHAAATGFNNHTWQLAWALRTYFDRRGHWHDQATTGQAAVAAAKRLADPTAQALSHRIVTGACTMLNRFDEAHTHLSHALDLYRLVGDQAGQAQTHRGLNAAQLRGRCCAVTCEMN